MIKVNSFGNDNKKEEVDENNKKLRTLSSSPYTINTTIKRNIEHFNSKKIENKISYYEIGKTFGGKKRFFKKGNTSDEAYVHDDLCPNGLVEATHKSRALQRQRMAQSRRDDVQT